MSLALFICSYMFQGLAHVDLANLKWGDVRDVEVIDKEKHARDSGEYGIDYANENKEAKLEHRRAERQDQERDDASKE